MRHVIGFGLAAVTAAVLFFAGGWATESIQRHMYSVVATGGAAQLGYVAVLLATGLLVAVLVAAPRVSPLAAGLPGLALVVWSVLSALDPSLAFRLIPTPTFDIEDGFSTLLATGLAATLGAVLVVPLFMPSRWRGDAAQQFGLIPGNSAAGGAGQLPFPGVAQGPAGVAEGPAGVAEGPAGSVGQLQ